MHQIIDDYNKWNDSEYSLKNCAYIGDDMLDIQCMASIKSAGGIVGCPMDAIDKVKRLADFVSCKNGGNGAVREFIEWLILRSSNE